MNVPVEIRSYADAKGFFGEGSWGAATALRAFAVGAFAELPSTAEGIERAHAELEPEVAVLVEIYIRNHATRCLVELLAAAWIPAWMIEEREEPAFYFDDAFEDEGAER